MSGHSKFANIKHNKEKNDAAKVLRQFQADRTYILEFDRKLHTEVCTYEISVEGIKERKVLLSESPIDYASWWTGQILAGNPIILFTLNLLPDSAGTFLQALLPDL